MAQHNLRNRRAAVPIADFGIGLKPFIKWAHVSETFLLVLSKINWNWKIKLLLRNVAIKRLELVFAKKQQKWQQQQQACHENFLLARFGEKNISTDLGLALSCHQNSQTMQPNLMFYYKLECVLFFQSAVQISHSCTPQSLLDFNYFDLKFSKKFVLKLM